MLLCRALAPLARRSRSTGKEFDAGRVKTIVVVKFCCLGDAILMGPGLRDIRAAYPTARITVITTAKTSGIIPSLASIDEVIELPFSTNVFMLRRSLGRFARPDLLYCFEPWYSTATLVSFFLWPLYSVGFTSPRAPYNESYFDAVVPYRENRHVVETYRELAWAGIQRGRPRQERRLSIQAEDHQRVTRFFRDQGLDGDVVAMFAGGSPTWLRKRWPADRFAALADRIISEMGMPVLLLTGRGQEPVNEAIVSAMRARAVAAPGDFSVMELASVLRRCRALVSSDSSPIHIASAVATPVVAMFGPVSPVTYRPYLPDHLVRIVSKNLPCSPCVVFGKCAPCPIDFECVRSITVDEVFGALQALLAGERLTTAPAELNECTL